MAVVFAEIHRCTLSYTYIGWRLFRFSGREMFWCVHDNTIDIQFLFFNIFLWGSFLLLLFNAVFLFRGRENSWYAHDIVFTIFTAILKNFPWESLLRTTLQWYLFRSSGTTRCYVCMLSPSLSLLLVSTVFFEALFLTQPHIDQHDHKMCRVQVCIDFAPKYLPHIFIACWWCAWFRKSARWSRTSTVFLIKFC